MLLSINKISKDNKILIEVLNSRTLKLSSTEPLYCLYSEEKEIYAFTYNGSIIQKGDIIDIQLKKGSLRYKVNIINEITEKRVFDISHTTKNKTTHFILPMIGGKSENYMVKEYLFNSFLNKINENIIHIVYRFFPFEKYKEVEEMLKKHKYFIKLTDISKDFVMFDFAVPEEFKDSIVEFKKGKYSLFNPKLKQMILSFYSLHKTGDTAQVLFKTEKRKKELELQFDTEIRNNTELYDIMNGKEEYLDLDSLCSLSLDNNHNSQINFKYENR